MLGKRKDAGSEEYVHVTERLRPYVDDGARAPEPAPAAGPAPGEDLLTDLVERAKTLLSVMPRNQPRHRLEELLAPYDPDRARRAVDELIATDVVIEEPDGRLRRVR